MMVIQRAKSSWTFGNITLLLVRVLKVCNIHIKHENKHHTPKRGATFWTHDRFIHSFLIHKKMIRINAFCRFFNWRWLTKICWSKFQLKILSCYYFVWSFISNEDFIVIETAFCIFVRCCILHYIRWIVFSLLSTDDVACPVLSKRDKTIKRQAVVQIMKYFKTIIVHAAK